MNHALRYNESTKKPLGKRYPTDKALKLIWTHTPNQSPPKSYTAGLRQVWRHVTAQSVLTQEEIPEEGR